MMYYGQPKTPTLDFTVRSEYYWLLNKRLVLNGSIRACLIGTADLIISDDFTARSRLVLSGRNPDGRYSP